MINFNKNLLDLDGKEIEGANIGKIVAQTLVQSSKGDALKYWGWATKLNAGEELDLDKSDTETIKNFIKESETLTILTKAQALECFE
jgi:hypothetical protein